MRMIVTGGGTGGHLFPGIAVAEEMLRRFPEGKILFVSTDRAIDNKALAGRSFAKKAIACLPIKGKSLWGTIRSVAQLPISLWQALRIVGGFKPQLVLGVGGYVTGPVVLAAHLMGVKTCIHEQNSIPGMANRMLGKIVDQVYISIPGSEDFFPKGKSVLTGNPVRAELLATAAQKKEQGAEKTVLVLGGSQGAHRVNALMVEALTAHQSGESVRVHHQTGNSDEAWVRKAYEEAGVPAQVSAFITEMAVAYRDADLVVSRAGATTLAELAVLGKPAILIPYPYAADDHQTTNAAYLVRGGAAVMFQERDLDGSKLRETILGLLDDGSRLQGMATQMRQYGRPEATDAIVEKSMELLAA
ncbi:undecaprenyldiphospho-muramoylpentapeptide beta-N-acetylglucosaminyltransferase [Thiovibrio frasassiensis]|uniref:UDP-N-acetylglucosamine--N-acetylmuramyl-(pentapeptide) pyrophosphoryl-undecaprenol N-acetylglucosamine transferase n=1 Tax=Thiovibrio frasassiensis TaxID=2984131 RepID=A0A9X4MFY4_9BACT|nr:undecaprenyldiphospho-muramoylpentapeptide beta-N-acetylglucosaminyltransferase [Thiovibrio frasassiensis]MDG4475917.1 undecaprenyldiphospho-muramoylpentapeptide beta-N-acetylglucosaminyltransferase [Thiovibrio frasassiensis]